MLPLILLPYLARVLEKDNFGKALFTQSLVGILSLLPEYGFNLSATRQIAIAKFDKLKLQSIISETIAAKVLLIIPALIFLIFSFFFIPIFQADTGYYIAALFLLVLSSMNVDWFFYGVEKFRFTVVVQVVSKLIFLTSVLIFISSPATGGLYVFLLSLSVGIPSMVNLLYITKSIKLTRPSFHNVISLIKESSSLFLFKLLISFYTSLNTVIVGLFHSPGQVGIYAGGEKLIKAMVGVWHPLGVVLYPRLSSLISENKNNAYRLFKRALAVYVILGLLLTVLVYLLSGVLVGLFLGSAYKEAETIIQILSPSVLLIALSNMIGINWLLPNKKDMQFNIVIVTAAVSNIVLGVPATIAWGIVGSAISALFAEFIVTLGCLMVWRKMSNV